MSPLAFLLIGVGAACGAWLRWLLGLFINPLFPAIPLGTLAANLLGGYLMGIALGTFQLWPSLSPELRLMITTGFLGGLTTFSTFSAETTTMLLRQQLGLGLGTIALHVCGSLLLTWFGLMTVQFLFQRG
ncbi:fluoride efflux transporter CrcB [Chitinilyticum piscinae]|uniref:Fluoride-specific ion channel FluC n=1 Tax=Chitinilyticum piscinae TaxID=2866724 RepID=A0A8J7KED3_9NEIS|nr:fluoride efflux transporter CrcB [Chitinilyticum piscinae]MBE9609384.1 fluoride efflux transporter CrcB [Chitinilyticum piscinae]